jgi:glycosyltransferase involved in cell wall biosynthesis
MAKIVIITNRLVIGGPAIHLLQVVGFFQHSHEITLVYGQEDVGEKSMVAEFEKLNVRLVKFNSLKRSLNLINDLIFSRELFKLINRIKPDIVHTHTYKPGFVGRYVAYRTKVPTIIHTYHGLLFETYFSPLISSILVYADRYLAKRTSHIIALSAKQKQTLLSQFQIASDTKILLIPLGINQQTSDFSLEQKREFLNRWELASDRVLIAQVGRLVEVKNVELSIQVLANIKAKSSKEFTFLIVGDGHLKQKLVDKARLLGLTVATEPNGAKSADVIFTSWCQDLLMLYSAIDILVLSSRSEGTPLSIMEAQMAGKAVVAPSIGGIPDMITHNETGLLFDSELNFEIALNQLINSPKLIEQLGDNAAKYASVNYSTEQMFKKYELLYK